MSTVESEMDKTRQLLIEEVEYIKKEILGSNQKLSPFIWKTNQSDPHQVDEKENGVRAMRFDVGLNLVIWIILLPSGIFFINFLTKRNV